MAQSRRKNLIECLYRSNYPVVKNCIWEIQKKQRELVQRPINNWINHAECFFECAGQKTQAQRATSRIFDLCNRRSRQVIGVVIFETLYQLTKLQNADIKSCMIVRQMSKLLENHTWLLQQKNPGNLTVPGHLTFGHNTPDGVIYMILSVNQ